MPTRACPPRVEYEKRALSGPLARIRRRSGTYRMCVVFPRAEVELEDGGLRREDDEVQYRLVQTSSAMRRLRQRHSGMHGVARRDGVSVTLTVYLRRDTLPDTLTGGFTSLFS